MFKDWFIDSISGRRPMPNDFSIGMGKLIRTAREEVGFSQRDLAELIYRRQAALSDIENGKMEPDATTLLLLSYHLNKPFIYFIPNKWKPNKLTEQMSEEEQELLIQAKRLTKDDLHKLIAQAKALADLTKGK